MDPPLRVDTPPSEPIEISNVVVQASDTSANVTWQTNLLTVGQGAFGLGPTPAVWAPADAKSDVEHETDLAGLAASTDYTLWLQATDDWGRTSLAQVQVATEPAGQPADVTATTQGDAIVVSGAPFFPRALWATCPSDVPKRIDDGINLFMGGACSNEQGVLKKLSGDSFSVTDPSTGIAESPGIIGFSYPDELDARLPLTDPTAPLKSMSVDPPQGQLTFLNLTNHFYSGADPLPQGRAMYPDLVQLANVLSFDLYPLQNWCRYDRFAAVYEAQRELEMLAQGKPTFQWIEVRQMDCPGGILTPTPATVSAETWLSIAGGADGIGYFPNNWSNSIGETIRDLNTTITELAPALLGPETEADSNQDAVKVGARIFNGAIYVIAVNSTTGAVNASIHVPGLAGRTISVLDESRQVTASNTDTITDGFEPLGVHLYIAAPLGWNSPNPQ